MSYARDTLGLVKTSAFALPAALCANVMVTRWLSVEGRGYYALALTFASMSAMFVQLGWPTAVIHMLRGVRRRSDAVASVGLLSGALLALIGVVAALGLEDWLRADVLEGMPSSTYRAAVGLIPVLTLATILRALARGIGRFDLQNSHDRALAIGVACVVLVVGGWRQATASEVLVASLLLQVALALWLGARVLGVTGATLRFDRREVATAMFFGSRAHIVILLARIHESADLFLISVLLGSASEVAFYALALTFVGLLTTLPEWLCVAAFPRLAGQTDAEAGRFAALLCRRTFATSMVLASLAAAALPLLLPALFGSDYAASVAPALWLLPGVAVFTVYRVLGRYFASRGRYRPVIAAQSMAVVLNLGLNLLWIPRYGISGAAAGSLVSYALQSVLLALAFSRATGIPLRDALWPRADELRRVLESLVALRRGPGRSTQGAG